LTNDFANSQLEQKAGDITGGLDFDKATHHTLMFVKLDVLENPISTSIFITIQTVAKSQIQSVTVVSTVRSATGDIRTSI